MPRFLYMLISLVITTAGLSADGADKPVDYERDVRPLIHSRCVTCHGALRSQAALRLDTGLLMRKGGDSGAAVMAGEAAKSLLVERIASSDPDLRMPPEGDPLNAAEIALLTRWVEEGARSPANEKPLRNPNDHWAFTKPERPVVPDNSQFGNPIDRFLAARRKAHGLVAAPQASPRILLRRVYLDLTGLPPTPEQLLAFEQSPTEEAWRKIVDELLASPHHGERWGRHWMDVWRYSDWYGYRGELRNSARHIWRWRDWIVESSNEDKPYNQMILEMLAGDELAPNDPATVRATGFLARSYFKFNRDTWLNGTIEHTSKAFLGLTINCARCHDHMYDPISQKDFYQFRAIFEPYQVRTDRMAGRIGVTNNAVSLAYDGLLTQPTFLYVRGNDKRPDKDNPLNPALPEFFSTELAAKPIDLPPEASYPGLREHAQKEALAEAEASLKEKQIALQKAKAAHASAKDALAKSSPRQKPSPAALRPDPETSTETPQTPDKATGKRELFFEDDFTAETDAWEFGPGSWKFENGLLRQSAVGPSRRTIALKTMPPQDFSATFAFTITGGEKWKSVGIDFDMQAEDTSQTVYLSAYDGGPKAQYSYRVAGKTTYPQDATKPLPIKLKQKHTLKIEVQQSLLNVSVDGKLALAYRLPMERRPGQISFWAFDAAAEFHSVRIEKLDGPVVLAEAASKPAQPSVSAKADPKSQLEIAALSLEVAKLDLNAAQTNLEFQQARIQADRAEFGLTSNGDAEPLARLAAKLSRSHAVQVAKALVKRRETETLEAAFKPAADRAKATAAAKKNLAAAKKQLKDAEKTAQTETTDYPKLTVTYPKTSTGRRLALARWIASEQNPLTARVAVNHVWLRHFGEPLVASVFDFGMNGSQPSHPKLLDWLAVELMENDWSLKHLHRLIMTSSAWRMQSSTQHDDRTVEAALAASAKTDPENRWLWRANPRRMESEIVRDCVLAVSGQLDVTRGGPELDQDSGLTSARRSIYYRHAPEKQVTFLAIFDTASTDECYRRNETIVPQQALALVNSQLAIEQSRHLTTLLHTRHKLTAKPESDTGFVEAAFQRILCRSPTPDELTECRSFLATQTAKFQSRTNLTAFNQGPKLRVSPSPDPLIRSRENLAHVLLNHNDFVTVR
jgi:hypothetical protein